MLYLLVGPTGVGKTTLGQAAAAAIPNCKFYELERLVAVNARMASASDVMRVQGPDHYWRLCARILQAVKTRHEKSLSPALCAVGQCTLESARARTVLCKYPNSILIWAPPEEVYRRSGWWPERPFRQFVAYEYGTYPRAVYEEIGRRLRFDVTGLDKEAACKGFVEWFRKVLAPPTEKT